MFKLVKAYANAVKQADGRPFLRVGNVYLVPVDPDRLDLRYVKIQIMGRDNEGGQVSVAMIDSFSKGYKLPKLEEA